MPSLLLEKQWRVGACDEHKKLKKQRRTHRDMFLIIPSTAATAAPIQPNLSSTKDLQTCCDCCVTPSSWYPPPLQKNDTKKLDHKSVNLLRTSKKARNPIQAEHEFSYVFFLTCESGDHNLLKTVNSIAPHADFAALAPRAAASSWRWLNSVPPSNTFFFFCFFVFFYPKQMMVSLSKNF